MPLSDNRDIHQKRFSPVFTKRKEFEQMTEEMTVKFKCSHCLTSLEAGSKLIGKTGKCPYCSKEITVPEKDEQASGEGNETPKEE
ncbi:MAG: hypothetical protein PVH77_03670 [Phycisphaerales bacterium]|jgi:DNA-directed RNA polymerase subunit RPC12/RpoP